MVRQLRMRASTEKWPLGPTSKIGRQRAGVLKFSTRVLPDRTTGNGKTIHAPDVWVKPSVQQAAKVPRQSIANVKGWTAQ